MERILISVFLLYLCVSCLSSTHPAHHLHLALRELEILNHAHHPCYCHHEHVKEGCGFLMNYSMLVNQPSYAPGQAAPCLLMHQWIVAEPPIFSIIITVHNQEEAIRQHALAVLELTTELWELVVVLDDCRDQSEKIVMSLLKDIISPCQHAYNQSNNLLQGKHCINPTLRRIMVIRQRSSVFETTASNIGLRASLGQFFVLLQDDMRVRERGWNTLLAQPVRLWSDVMAVTARCAEGGIYSDLGRWSWLWSRQKQIGSACPSTEIDYGGDRILQQCIFRIRDSVNRGPLLLDGRKAVALGFFDELNFLQGDDDHDFCTRGWMTYRWKCGVLDIDFTAPLHLGASRKRQRGNQSEVLAFVRFREERRTFLPTADQRFNPALLDPAFIKEGRPSHDEDRVLPGRCRRSQSWWSREGRL